MDGGGSTMMEAIRATCWADRASHYWNTPEAGGKVDKDTPTQVGRALAQLGIELIPAYSPEARGRSERMFGTLQKRLPQELRLAGITDMVEANRFLKLGLRLERACGSFPRQRLDGLTAFVPFTGALDDISRSGRMSCTWRWLRTGARCFPARNSVPAGACIEAARRSDSRELYLDIEHCT